MVSYVTAQPYYVPLDYTYTPLSPGGGGGGGGGSGDGAGAGQQFNTPHQEALAAAELAGLAALASTRGDTGRALYGGPEGQLTGGGGRYTRDLLNTFDRGALETAAGRDIFGIDFGAQMDDPAQRQSVADISKLTTDELRNMLSGKRISSLTPGQLGTGFMQSIPAQWALKGVQGVSEGLGFNFPSDDIVPKPKPGEPEEYGTWGRKVHPGLVGGDILFENDFLKISSPTYLPKGEDRMTPEKLRAIEEGPKDISPMETVFDQQALAETGVADWTEREFEKKQREANRQASVQRGYDRMSDVARDIATASGVGGPRRGRRQTEYAQGGLMSFAHGGRPGFKEGTGFSRAMEIAQDKLKTRALEILPWSVGIPFNELSPKHQKEVIDSFSPGELLGKAQGGRIGFWEGGLVGYSRGGIASL